MLDGEGKERPISTVSPRCKKIPLISREGQVQPHGAMQPDLSAQASHSPRSTQPGSGDYSLTRHGLPESPAVSL